MKFFTTTILLIACIFSSGFHSYAQGEELIRVRPRDDPRRVIPFTKRYKYNPFKDGHALFSNGKTSPVYPFNYDFLYGEMRLIKRGIIDTLFVVNDQSLQYVFIGDDIFQHDYRTGYILLLAEAHSAKLGVRQLLRKKRNESSMNTGYGLITDYTSASYSAVDVMLHRRSYFYFISDDDQIRKARRSTLLKTFPKYKGLLEAYFETHKVNFNKQTDLHDLFQYCRKLPD